MSSAHQLYIAALAAADEAHKVRMKEALERNSSESGADPALSAALVAADYAHFEALRISEARRVSDRKVARTAFRTNEEPH